MKKILFIICSIFMINTNAGILIDPYLTFMDKTKVDDAQGSEVRGTTLGIRLAYNSPLYFVGIDYEKSLESEWISSSVHREVEVVNAAFLFGYRPIPILKTWFKYYFSANVAQASAIDYGGKGVALGIGVDVRTNTTLFAEYRNIKFDICDPESSCTEGETNLKGVVFGIAFPILM